MAHLSQILSELESAADKLYDLSDEVSKMVVIDDKDYATQSMNMKIKNIMYELRKAARNIESNRDTIESCCGELGLSVRPVAHGGGSSVRAGGGANTDSRVTYTAR